MTDSGATLTAEQQALLREAAWWRLISLLFECPRDEWQHEVAALAAETSDGRLREAAAAAVSEASEGLHHAIFGPGGPVSPREVTYLGGVQLGYLLSELNAYYGAFAYRPATGEPADHLAVETGFVAYLLMKQAYALACGNEEQAAVAAEAAARFRSEHLSLMAGPIAAALEDGGPPFLAAAAGVLLERVGPPGRTAHPGILELATEDEEGETHCGLANHRATARVTPGSDTAPPRALS